MTKQTDTVALIGRIFLAVLFLLSASASSRRPAATQAYIAAMGLPAPTLAYLGSTAVEVIGGVLLIVGFRVRPVALGMGRLHAADGPCSSTAILPTRTR
ncbi:MAG: DoxX family protein [Aliidongia sp.]